ncbi:MAG: glycosyltransferase [Nitrospirae bacterium]|nr:glycosyltransferase [Nitrospirota bacterium]
MNIDNLISVAAVINNNADIMESFIKDTTDAVTGSYANYELVLIDNGSTDASVLKVKELQKRINNIRLIILSKKYDDEITYQAALNNCIGDFVVLMDPNYDPPSLIPQLIDRAISGFDVVIAERTDESEKPFLDKLFSFVFFKLSRFLTGYNVRPGFSKFIVFSRRAVNSIVRIKDRSRYIKYLLLEIGYNRCAVPYARINRSGRKKKENYFNAFTFAIEVIVSNSEKLIRIASFIGLLASMLNLFLVLYVVVGFIFFRAYIPQGWTSTQLVNATMFFLMFLMLAIIGEYVARVLRETKKGDIYFLADESNSSVFPGDADRKNVI